MIEKPSQEDYHPFYHTYVSKVPEGDVLDFLNKQSTKFPEFLRAIADKADYRYGPDKWTLAELLHHMCDAERVFSYRAFAIARGEQAALPGMDQNDYQDNAHTAGRSFESLVQEFEAIRAATLALVNALPAEVIDNRGVASGGEITVRSLITIIAGHVAHHQKIIQQRYL